MGLRVVKGLGEAQGRRVYQWVSALPGQGTFDALWPMLRVG